MGRLHRGAVRLPRSCHRAGSIGRPPGRQEAADFVLTPFGKQERETLPSLLADAADATEMLITDGLLETQQRFHAPRV